MPRRVPPLGRVVPGLLAAATIAVGSGGGAASGRVAAGLREAASGRPPAGPEIGGCHVFPADNPWNQRVDALPVARDSAAIIARIGADSSAHPDFGTVYDGAPNGIPVTVVSDPVNRERVRFVYGSESDHARYPLPRASGSRAGRARPATGT